ncbi:MAG: YfcE family phosphodiesterase [Anaerolineae bacterium]|jgi:putative phosphoesterase|nr:YfcE family phosphodiesterase [Anaerolineae bacterium]
MEQRAGGNKEFVIAVVSDTHVPDRCTELPESLLPKLRALQPDLILHAGDVVTSKVIQILEEVAPVIMVKGNRDIYFFPYVPRKKELSVFGVSIVLIHGHADLLRYLVNKVRNVLFRYRLDWFLPTILQEGEGADVIVFGHTHRQMNEWQDGQLLFNPGSVTISPEAGVYRSYGVLRISDTGKVNAEIISL